MNPKIIIVTSYQDQVDVEICPDRFCPKGHIYFMTDRSKPLINYIKDLYSTEKELNEWIRAYQNAIQGLNYWKQRALHK